MSSSSKLMEGSASMFQLKGGLYPLTALQMLGADLPLFETQLAAKIQLAPKFFHRAPIVVDLQKLHLSGVELDFKKLLDILIRHQLSPVGVKGGHKEQQAAATLAGLPIFQDGGKDPVKSSEEPALKTSTPSPSKVEAEIRGSNSKIVTEPVRSGQQIYVRGGDLIVLAPVSHGSELLADGNIHVYGPLRGRALAGVTGDETAHIFCQSLEAELVSIAGQYKISEDIDQTTWRLSVDISLEEGRLHIRAL